MKIKMETFTAVGTWVLAICAIFALCQTANTQREAAELNAKATEYYERQNQSLLPSFHIENKTLPEYEGLAQKIALPLPYMGPDKFIKDIRVYNDGGRIKTLSVDIETYIVIGLFDHVNLFNNQGCLMFVPVKDYYAGFEQNGQVKGLVANGGISPFQEKVYNAMTNYNARHAESKEIFAQPFDFVEFHYEDINGQKIKSIYSSGMEIGNTLNELDMFTDSKEIFKGKSFTADTFDLDKILKEYAPQFVEREKIRSEKRKDERAAKMQK